MSRPIAAAVEDLGDNNQYINLVGDVLYNGGDSTVVAEIIYDAGNSVDEVPEIILDGGTSDS